MNINIFAKRAFLNTSSNVEFVSKKESYKGNGHLQRVSSMIRADQIAEYLGAKVNPEVIGGNSVCIYVKPHLPKGVTDFNFEGKRNYIDIIDGWGLIPLLEKHPEIGVIACSEQDKDVLTSILHNKVVNIPQHHCNFERVKRDRKGITTVGIIGTENAFDYLPKGLEEGLSNRGITFLKYSKFFSREDIVDFYKQIDVQLVWRPYRMRLSNPLKIVNAASFGIPSIAYDETVFSEMQGCYLPVKTLDDIFADLYNLKTNPLLYEIYSKLCLEKAEKYHIQNIAKLYKQL